jgi:hypothetical protein
MGNSAIPRPISGFGGQMRAGAAPCCPGKLAGTGKTELEFQSRSPVSQAVARSGTMAWHLYRS